MEDLLPSNVDTLPTHLAGPDNAIRQLLDAGTPIASTEPQDQTVNTALRSHIESPECVAHHQRGQDIQNIAIDAGGLKGFQGRSLVTRFPPETLARIFELYVVQFGESTFGGILHHGPFSLAQVCKLWREVVESDPHLWTSIHVYFPESRRSRKEDASRVGPVFDQHLKRSGTLPVSLTFTDHRSYDSATEDLVSLLVDRLRTHARRWKRISFQLSGYYFPLIFTFAACDLSNLEHLYISGDVVDVLSRSTTLHLNLESATHLRSFAYSGPGPSVKDSIYLHWENLAEVSLEFPPHRGKSYTLSQHFRYLAQCQNLTTCSLGIDRSFLDTRGNQPVTFPHLQTLRVRRLSPLGRACGAVDLLILPQLERLEIDAPFLVFRDHRWPDHSFSELLARSGCSLLHLSIQDVHFPNDELVRCLGLSPALISLRFIPCPRSQDISDLVHKLDILRTPTGEHRTQGHGGQQQITDSGPLIPQLREISLASSEEGYLDSIMAMFRSRSGFRARDAIAAATRVAPLRSAQVVFFNLWHDMALDRARNPGHWWSRVAGFRADLARWVSENRNEDFGEKEDEDRLEASVVVNSPYLPEYINVQ